MESYPGSVIARTGKLQYCFKLTVNLLPIFGRVPFGLVREVYFEQDISRVLYSDELIGQKLKGLAVILIVVHQ